MVQFDTVEMRADWSRLLRHFESCAPDKNTRNYFRIYTQGIASNLPKKNAESIALQAKVPPRSVQWFLAKQGWDHDRDRCREAGIPDEIVYRPKWVIAIEQYDRAIQNGVSFEWLTFDKGYGGKPEFLRQLEARNQLFIGEVPCTFHAWSRLPKTTMKQEKIGKNRKKSEKIGQNRDWSKVNVPRLNFKIC